MIDLFDLYKEEFNAKAISPKRTELLDALKRPFWQEFNAGLEKLPDYIQLRKRNPNYQSEIQQGILTFGTHSDLTKDEHEILLPLLKHLVPWRKGPISFFGHSIDTEWRSDWKWERMAPGIPNMRGMRVADIGCNNGYYMYHMLKDQPRFVWGLDPSEKYFQAFKMMQKFAAPNTLDMDMLGVEELFAFPNFFDIVFCLGVIYHRKDPIGMLQDVHQTLRKGGQAIIESISMPGNGPYALSPPARYSKMRNVFFFPTSECLVAWMQKAGFKEVKIISHSITTTDEQKRSDWMPFESLEQYLDPEDHSKTLEGYPAPERTVVVGTKK